MRLRGLERDGIALHLFVAPLLVPLAALLREGFQRSVYAAALMDGAGLWQMLWRVTLPSVRFGTVSAPSRRSPEDRQKLDQERPRR